MDKNDELMAALGLSSYCMSLENLREQELWDRFQELERNADQIRRSIQQKIELYRSQLEEQYSVVFGALGASRQPEGVQ
jgi:hypothetical protein